MINILPLNNINNYSYNSHKVSNRNLYIKPTFKGDSVSKPKYKVGNPLYKSGFYKLQYAKYSQKEVDGFNLNRTMPDDYYIVSAYKDTEKNKKNNILLAKKLSPKMVKKLKNKGKLVTKTIPKGVSLESSGSRVYLKDDRLVDLKNARTKQTIKSICVCGGIIAASILGKILLDKKYGGADSDYFDIFDIFLITDLF